jgi:hypothetical protein
MQTGAGIIELLNDVLTAELTAVNQYFVHAKMQANWGYRRLAEKGREESFGEMKHAEELIERILYLEGVPNMQRLGTVQVGETSPSSSGRSWRPRRPPSPGSRPGSSSAAAPMRAPGSCWKRSSTTRRSTPTGSRPSST